MLLGLHVANKNGSANMLQHILDLPVIAQGALGSAAFWLVYEVSKRLINAGYNLLGKFSSETRRDLKSLEFFYHKRCAGGSERTFIVSMFHALNRLVIALIFICLGLISAPWIGAASGIAYLFAIFNLFISLRALKISFSTDMTDEEHEAKAKELAEDLTSQEGTP
ncbi:hypothetical protein NCG89_13430 [Spongiibacter taiwanensis]|uniref:hypothetical protein n=1 Tax=Spongiibacter taiwanensis TaxID=1748242 RepID=UPI002034C3FB|nr:hypothetical protein [Spongiibacter taiwanensis]USA42529.1 hypothetical protein NCG89_13430 [Spongiibacter taiwanensis]